MKSWDLGAHRGTNPHLFSDHASEYLTEQTHRWQWAALMGIVVLAGVLRFVHLDQQGFGNLYYAAGVQSMLQSWHTFFFVAFDPQGFLAIDKPPLGLWIQVASVALFGWSGWSLFFPQALAGTLSVGLLFLIVQRTFGINAGLFAALVLALTPIAVATDRNNTMDSFLVFILLLATMCVGGAAEQGTSRLLLLGAVCVGVGFNIKMLQAFLPLPAFCVWYVAVAPRQWQRRSMHLALALGVVGLVSLPWILTVDMTPASMRPYIASSSNSEFDLVLGHNGGARLMENPFHASIPLTTYVTDEIGFPGPLRMWQQQLGGQASWLLPLALLGLCVALWKPSANDPLHSRSAVVMWGTWLVLELFFFSVGRKFHRYYLVMLGPPIAALTGIGVVTLWRWYHADDWRTWLLPCALFGTATGQVSILRAFPDWGRVFIPVVVGMSVCAACTLVVLRWRGLNQWAHGVVIVGVASLLVAPTAWAMTPLWGAHPSQPYAGPDLFDISTHRDASVYRSLGTYLRDHQHGEHFLAATLTATTAAPMMLHNGGAIMALGGYSGGDSILTPEQFATRVASKDVRFVLLPDTPSQQPALVAWVTAQCIVVPPRAWTIESDESRNNAFGAPVTLFDCKP